MALRILLRSRLGLRPAVRLCFFRSLQARMYSLDHDRTSQPTATGSARIWVRGTPQRFKLRGLVISSLIASLLSGLIYIWSTESDTLHRRGLKLDAVSALVRVQFVDSEKYATVDFSSYQASLDYFAHLLGFTPYLTTLKPGRDLFEVFSFEFEDTKRRDQVHTILRETAEKVHILLAQNRREEGTDPTITGLDVIRMLFMARYQLAKLSLNIDDSESSPDKIQLYRVMATKDAEPKSHEVLG